MAQIIDGKALAKKIREELKGRVAQLKQEKGIVPGLATVLVGDDQASQVYVRNKNKACAEAGMISKHHHLAESTSEKDLLDLVATLNADPSIHGILVQLPLPKQIDAEKVLEAIDPAKDVDGFHPMNVGKLLIGKDGPRPCTPFGIMKIIESINCELKGKNAVIVGRSNIVGKPLALMLMEKHATITICHSRTQNIDQVVGRADVVIAAMGKARFVKGEWIKDGAIVIDVGINRGDDGKLVGDVDFEIASRRASFITPVPGGVGPMTIAMLLWNTVEAAKK